MILAVREKAKAHNPSNAQGEYDSIHVRRGDFQYKKTRVEPEDIYKMTKRQLPEGTTLYIATDERDKSFFDPLKEHYHVLFLDHFEKELGNINSNFYGKFNVQMPGANLVRIGCLLSTVLEHNKFQ